MLVNILIGLVLLSVLVFVHESGHFIAARLCGVEVEAFSVGFGPVLLKKKIGKTEYRLSLLPLGGYCSMKGENAFAKALEENLKEIPKEEAGFYSVSKWRRILIAFAGPFANYLFAVVGFAVVAAIGTTYYTSSNQIAPVYYYDGGKDSPAKAAGLQMGDRIVKIDGESTPTFDALSSKIALNPQTEMTFTVERSGSTFDTKITPALDKETGAGKVGFYSYVPLKVSKVKKDSIAEKIGMRAGDQIIKMDGSDTANTQDLIAFFQKNKGLKTVCVSVMRDGQTLEFDCEVPYYDEKQLPNFGFIFESVKVAVEGKGFFSSIAEGFVQTHKTIAEVFRSFGLLFKGINLRSALAGPISISSMMGESAKVGFGESFLQGIYNIASFASFICISLFIMNLLPIPVLDGGIIFVTLIEMIARRSIRPKVLYYVQLAGSFFVLALAGFALWADFGRLFLSR